MSGFLSRRWSFWLALFSCIAFLIGNMVGQHGWGPFWKSVWGKETEIEFNGTVSPLASVPDPERWSGDNRLFDYSDVPEELLMPLPEYKSVKGCGEDVAVDRSIYLVRYGGSYGGGGDNCGSHVGVDVRAPKGTPAYAIANGIVERVEERGWGFGNTVVLKIPNAPDPDNPGKTTTLYAGYGHLGHIHVKEGQVVQKGEQIAVTGQTGFATTPHLDFHIAREEAPFKPYWAFTTTQATQAGYSFVDAVNAGLGKENVEKYTVSPFLYVQDHQNFTSPRTTEIAAVPDERAKEAPKHSSGDERKERIAQRIADRGTKTRSPVQSVVVAVQETVKTVTSTVTESETWRLLRSRMRARRAERIARIADRDQNRMATQMSLSLHGASSEEKPVISDQDSEEVAHEDAVQITEVSTAEKDIPMPKSDSTVSSITIFHDGSFSAQRNEDGGRDWEEIVLFARDKNGGFIQGGVQFEGAIELGTVFGEAIFSPSRLTAEQFDERGRAMVRMQPRSFKTIVPVVQGAFTAQGEPLLSESTISARVRVQEEG